MTLQNRIKKQRKLLKLSLLDLAKKLNVSEATVQRYESGAIKQIPYETIVLLAEKLNVTPAFLMGWDEVQKESAVLPKRQQKTINRYLKLVQKAKVDDYVDLLFTSENHMDEEFGNLVEFPEIKEELACYEVPDYGIKATAGAAGVVNGDTNAGTIIVPKLPKSFYDYPITVVGDSMEPRYSDGDIVFVKKQNHLEHGETGIFETENGMVLKKFYNVPGQELKLLSHNPKYQPIVEGILRIEGKIVE